MNQLKNGIFTPESAAEPAMWLEAALVSGRTSLNTGKPLKRNRTRTRRAKKTRKPFRVRIEYVLPFFFAALIALNICALITLKTFSGCQQPPPPPPLPALEEPETPLLPEPFGGLSSAFLQEPAAARDLIAEYYRDPLSRDLVIDFFSLIAGSREIAETILTIAEVYRIPLSLAFAIAWEESRYRPRATSVRNRNGSIDRGLFQLNSHSFPKLSEADFFDIRTNTRNGLSHLRWCLDTGGSEIVALSMYNAGANRVNSSGAPRITLEYVERVLNSRRKIDGFFEAEVSRLNIEIPGPGITPLTELASMEPLTMPR
jgi:hypothetical protein